MASKSKTRAYYSANNFDSTVSFGMSAIAIAAVWSESLWGLRRTVLATNVEDTDRAMAADGTTKRLYLRHQDEFHHNYFDFVSLHHSDHNGVVRIFVGHSKVVKRLSDYITRHNFSPTRSVIILLLKLIKYVRA